MKKIYQKLGSMSFMLMIFTLLLASRTVLAADIVATTTGNFSSSSTWAGGLVPTSTDNIFIEAGVTVTVDGNVTINDLNLNAATGTRLAIANGFTISVAGKIRAYTGSAPGTASNAPSATIITTGTGALLKFIGATRDIQVSGQWGANPRSYNVEFALDPGAVGTLNNSFKAGNITISSGIIEAKNDLRADFNADGTGTITVKNGATLLSNPSASAFTNITRIGTASTTSQIAAFVLEAGATLEYTTSGAVANVGYIDANIITLLGTVLYTSSLPQTLATKPAAGDGAVPNTYADLTLQSGDKTLSTYTTVNGTLSMRAGTTAPSLVLNGFTLTYGNDAVLQYRGVNTAAQTTTEAEFPSEASAASKPVFVDFFNPNGVTLNGSKSILGNAKLSGGSGNSNKVTLGANNFSCGSVTITNDDGGKYFVTDGAGALTIRSVDPNAAQKFPVGPSAAFYHPAIITNTGATSSNYTVRVSSTTPPCVTAANSVNATWDISRSAATGTIDLVLDYGTASTGVNYSAASAQIVHCNGTGVDYADGSVTGTVATGNNFANFSPFGIASTFVLPVTLGKISGSTTKSGNVISWASFAEIAVNGYSVQRSTDGINFVDIAFVNSKSINGNSSVKLEYSYTDATAPAGKVYYRLLVSDNQARATFSNTVVLSSSAKQLNIEKVVSGAGYSNALVSVFSPASGKMNIMIVDANGRTVFNEMRSVNSGVNQMNLNVSNLGSAVYYLVISGNGEKATATFLK